MRRKLSGPRHDVRALELVEAAFLRGRVGAHRPADVLAVLVGGRVRAHRPELEGRERPLVEPEPRLPEQHRPWRVELDPDGDRREERRQTARAGRPSPRRRTRASGARPRGSSCSGAGSRAASPRSTSRWRSGRAPRTAGARRPPVRPASAAAVRAAASGVRSRPRTRTRRGRSRAGRRVSAAAPRRASTGTCGHLVAEPARRGVDEADERDPVLRMLEQLPGHELRVPVGTDDERRAGRGRALRRTSMRAADLATAIEHDRERPEDDPLPEVGAGEHP